MAKGDTQANSATKGKAIIQTHEQEDMDEGLLTQAFTKLTPCLTKNMAAAVEKYLDHLSTKKVLDSKSMTEILSKEIPKERVRELIVQVRQKKGASRILLDLFQHHDINQQDLRDKVLTEYKNAVKLSSKEKETDRLGETLNKLRIKDEPSQPTTSKESRKSDNCSGRKDAFGKYLEFRVCIVNSCASEQSSSQIPSAREIFFHIKEQQGLKTKLQCFVHDYDKKDGNWHSFISLKMPKAVDTNDFEWKELSPLLAGLSSGIWHGFVEKISIKPFVSEKQKKEITDQLNVHKDSETKTTKSGSGKKKGDQSHTPTTIGSEIPSRQVNGKATDNVDQPQASSIGPSSETLTRSVSIDGAVCKTGNTPPVPADLLPILRQVKFGVGKDSRKRASTVMNVVARSVVDSLKEQYRLVLRPEFSGSSFEGAKIEEANEFDMLILLDGKDLERVEYNPQFYYLRPRKADNPKFKEFLTNSGNIDPEKIISTMFGWVQRTLNSLFPVGCEYIVKVRRTGPAVTLSIESNPNGPKYEKDLGKIDVDLVATFEVLKEQFVAKPYQIQKSKSEASPDTVEETVTRHLWRKSFSLMEKERLDGIDKDGGCRRQCLRLFKFIRLRESTFKRLASYHYKILLLNECEKFQEREDWIADKLADRFWGLLASLKACLEEGILPHCMNHKINIFERIEPKVRDNMRDRVNKIMSKKSLELTKIFDKEQIS